MAVGNYPNIGDMKFRGKNIPDAYQDRVSTVMVDMSTTQITELTITFDDPAFELLDSGFFDIETPVKYRGLNLIVAVVETNAGGGEGGFAIRCRPRMVYKLKKLRGKKVRKSISPTTFIKSECDAVGITSLVAQKTGNKKTIKRDVKTKGSTYDETNAPSAWTTMQRLASEKGFLMYEIGDVIYFGQPTWLVKRSKTVEVVWEGNDSQAPMTFPEFRQSLDNEDVELTIELPIERAGTIYPGQGLQLSGYSKFSGTYFIQSVKYPLVGVGNVAVTASTVRNPEPQKSGDAGGTSSSDGKVKSREFNHPGSTQEAAKKYTKWDGKGKPKYGELVKVGGVWLPYGIDKAGKNVKFDFDKMNLKYSDDLEGFGNMFD